MDTSYAVEKFYPKILKFVATRARSKKETVDRLKKYLQLSDLPADEVEATIAAIILRLEEDRFIGDERLAKDFVSSIFNSSKPRGKQYVMRYLMQKGVPRSIIESALSKVDTEDEFTPALAAAEKKLRLLKASSNQKSVKNNFDLKRKLYAHLVGKGFSMDIISRVIDRALGVK